MNKVLVLGGGESGVGAALLAKLQGWQVSVSDYGSIEQSFKNELTKNKILFEEKGHSLEILDRVDLVIKSPGIPNNAPIIKRALAKDIQIISEIEFGYRYCQAQIIGITGSNGKTTTTSLMEHVLLSAGIRAKAGGNIGNSFCRLLTVVEEIDYYVLELSSFQLDDIVDFAPDYAIILNVTADHLDRYDYDIGKYAQAKFKIGENQTEDQVLLLNVEDEIVSKMYKSGEWSQRIIAIENIEYTEDTLVTTSGFKIDITDYALIGRHNMLNTIMVAEVCLDLGLSTADIANGLKSFQNIAHRLENVANINGIDYINDSKATNVDAVYYALDGIKQNIIWIAGGIDKGNDYTAIIENARKKVKALICLGKDNDKLIKTFSPHIKNIEEAGSMKEAVDLCQRYAENGDCVLLSPACSSFDLFKNYIDRGEQFKEEVWNILK